jgi:hypothetical protein
VRLTVSDNPSLAAAVIDSLTDSLTGG